MRSGSSDRRFNRRESHARPARIDGRPSHASAGRLAAYDIVSAAREREAYTHDIIEPLLSGRRLSREDRAFATMLALGVAASRGTLDEIIDRALDNPRDVKPDVRDALCISAFEIVFLGKDAYAAVDQGVELVRVIAPRAAGLANKVLRRIVHLAEDFPFGDPRSNIDALARSYAFPTWLAALLVSDIGEVAARDLMEASNGQAPVYVAVNALKATDAEVISALGGAGAHVSPSGAGGREVPGCYLVDEPRVIADGRIRQAVAEGKLLVSDASSQAIAQIALPDEEPSSFLEIGSGRATKTILLQSGAFRRWSAQVPITCVDSYAFKTRLARARTAAYGIEGVEFLTGDATCLDDLVGDRRFDAVFIDAPCSGLGTLRRHPEIRWHLSPDDIDELADVGCALLRSAASHVQPGGVITYATCTVTYAENTEVVKRFLKSSEGAPFRLSSVDGSSCFSTRVSQGSPDAHFAVRLARVS